MLLNLASTAPHIHPADKWQETAPNSESFVLHKTSDAAVEVGLARWLDGSMAFQPPSDMLFYFMNGGGVFRGANGEEIHVTPGKIVHFKHGWRGTLETLVGPIEASYMTCPGAPGESVKTLPDAFTAAPLSDWGEIPSRVEGTPHTSGILLSRDPDGRAESGIWTCTPGLWRCEVTSDEFCHFLEGSCTYTHDNGERIEIQPDTLACFPRGWSGLCEIRRAMRKVYMIR